MQEMKQWKMPHETAIAFALIVSTILLLGLFPVTFAQVSVTEKKQVWSSTSRSNWSAWSKEVYQKGLLPIFWASSSFRTQTVTVTRKYQDYELTLWPPRLLTKRPIGDPYFEQKSYEHRQYKYDFTFHDPVGDFAHAQAMGQPVSYPNDGMLADIWMNMSNVASYSLSFDGNQITEYHGDIIDFSGLSLGKHTVILSVVFNNGTSTEYQEDISVNKYLALSVDNPVHPLQPEGYSSYEINVTNNSFETSSITLDTSGVPEGWYASINSTLDLSPNTWTLVEMFVAENKTAPETATIFVTGTTIDNQNDDVMTVTSSSAASSTVNIGVLAPFYLTEGGGGTNGYGGMIDGANLAAYEINAAGGIQVGATKELISLDVQDEGAYDIKSGTFNPGTTDASMTEMLGKDQFIVGGFRTETTTEALTDLATYNRVPFFICGASTTDLIGPTYSGADAPWVFRVTPVNDTQLFLTVAGYIQQSLAPKLASIYTNSTWPPATPGKVRFAVVCESYTWTQQIWYLLTAPAGAPAVGLPGGVTPGYNYFLGPQLTTSGVFKSAGYPYDGDCVINPLASASDIQALVNTLKSENVHLIIDFFTMPEVNSLLGAVQRAGLNAMVVGVDVPGQQQSHWAATDGSTTAAGACNYEVNLCWSGTDTPIVPGYSAAFWKDFETYTASLPATAGAAKGAYWPMYTAAGAYEAIYAIKAAIETAGTTDTSNPALLAAIEATNYAGLSGQFKFTTDHDVFSADYGLNWTQYDPGWGWARSEVVQWVQNTTVPRSPAPDVGAQMNVVSPTNLVSSTGSTALPYALKTMIPPSMYSLATWDIGLYGKVILQDLVMFAKAYGSKPGDSNWNPSADILGNGVVGLSELVALAQHYGQSAPQWPLP